MQSYIVQERETAAVTHTRLPAGLRSKTGTRFSTRFREIGLKRVLFFLLSTTAGNNRLVNYGKISNSFSRELLSKRKEKKGKKNLSLALVFPRYEFRSISRADPESKKTSSSARKPNLFFPLPPPPPLLSVSKQNLLFFFIRDRLFILLQIVPDTGEFIRNA